EPSLPFMQPIAVTAPQFVVQAAAITPPSQVAPAAVQPLAAPAAPAAPQADANPYYQMVLRQIAQHKRYPAQAKRIRQQGLVEISFEISADGRLLSAQVSQSSQVPSLDAAALAAVTNASPFPPIPAELGVSRLRLSLPIEFSLR
ncbi:MAG TPA: energy transducer TonB, partial [Cellvibrionaceae bacterium]|nr:energy transducer TonB [Cellvibrionaceae bacterium]